MFGNLRGASDVGRSSKFSPVFLLGVIITGANQGGKSTFLRSLGLAQLMMQSRMFVGAESFEAELCPALFTHYKREDLTRSLSE
jgi:DNA mismatch repair ATPase MutS